MRWRSSLTSALVLVVVAASCGGQGRGSADPGTTTSTSAAADTPIALVMTDAGLAGVPVGSSEPLWVVPDAVAAPDGSAVFATVATGEALDVVRIDPRTGQQIGVGRRAPGLLGLHVAAVEPGGGRLALAVVAGEDTVLIDVDPAQGVGQAKRTSFEGEVAPEAYSKDRRQLYAARIYDDQYHVHVLDLATGEQWPTLGPDKTGTPEDMYGSVVQAALSPDGSQLATLYRDSTKPDHTAFVHLLDLESGSTVCIDLYAPFGTDAPGTDAIVWKEDGTVAVGHRGASPGESVSATFDPAAIWGGDPQPHYHAEAKPDPDPPSIPQGLAATPGFRRFIALAAPSADLTALPRR